MKTKDTWKLIGHSHAIADTGDYSTTYEITNGKISLFCNDDQDDELLETIVKALNDSGAKFFIEDKEFEIKMLKEYNAEMHKELQEAQKEIARK